MRSSIAEKQQVGAPARGARLDEITDWDRSVYRQLVSTELTAEQKARIVNPTQTYDRQETVLAVHWHPEFVPMALIAERVDALFPKRDDQLIIPTQHNALTEYGEFAGVEVDCYSQSFNRKVQLLIHFRKDRLQRADVFRSMLAHTFRYRSRQFTEFVESIIDPAYEDRMELAAHRAGADESLVQFVRLHTRKLHKLFLEMESSTPPEMVRNKLLTFYIAALRQHHDDHLVEHASTLVREIKMVVKERFSNQFFYKTEEVIEEVRALGGGIVIPHPEQFWPILLADYDVDGYEVWNPQSRQYTDFLIHVVSRQNKGAAAGQRRLLILMGDDCHMGEKVRDPKLQDSEKAGREIGVQPAWDDLAIRKELIVARADRRSVIEEYRARLGS